MILPASAIVADAIPVPANATAAGLAGGGRESYICAAVEPVDRTAILP